jgi:hypothetical protein
MNLIARTTAALAPTSQNGAVTHHHEHQMSPVNFRATSATPINPGIANTQIPPASLEDISKSLGWFPVWPCRQGQPVKPVIPCKRTWSSRSLSGLGDHFADPLLSGGITSRVTGRWPFAALSLRWVRFKQAEILESSILKK